jgi:hypothetical protein
MNIVQFRKQNPAYDDFSDKELSDALYSKYYSDLDRSEFDSTFTGGTLGEEREQERARLEQEFEVAEQERTAAQRNLEGAEDTVLENLAEGVQEMSAAGVGAVADVATLIASPVTYALEQTMDVDIPTGREALAMIDPRLDPNQQFMEERGLLGAGGVRLAGELATVGAGFVPVARDPTKISSAVQEIAGLGMTKIPVAPAAVVAKGTPEFTLDTVEGVKEFADDAAVRFDVEEARPKFESYEKWESVDLPNYEKTMAKLGAQWDKASKQLDSAEEKLREAVGSGNENRIAKAQASFDKSKAKLDEIETKVSEPPEIPSINATTQQRHSFIKQELKDAGVSDDVIKAVVLPQRYRKPKPFEELMQYDRDAMSGIYDIAPSKSVNLYDRLARPVSAVVSKLAGSRIGVLFESSFETAGRKQELFLNKYYSDEVKDSFAELVDWANNDNVKKLFLDLYKSPENLKAILQEGSSLSQGATVLLRNLVADSKVHQKEASKLFKEEVQQDEIYWASGTTRSKELDEGLGPNIETGRRIETGVQERVRGAAADMSPEDLKEYANPILEQVNRIAKQQTLIELSKSFRVRPSLGLSENTGAFFKELENTIAQQSNSPITGKRVADLANSTYIGARSRPASLIESFMRQSYGGTLGQFDSAFLNLHDAAVSMVKNGFMPTMKGIMQREGMRIQEFGIGGNNKNIGEFQAGFDDTLEKGLLQKGSEWYQEKSFKYSGFRSMDRVGKGIVLRGSLNAMRKAAKTGKFKEFEKYFSPQEAALIRKNLAQETPLDAMPEKVREIVLRGMFSKLGEQQLISAAGRPLNYLNNPAFRPVWALTGFAIKQAEMAKVGVIDNIASKNYKEAGKFAANYMIFAGLGYGFINQARGLPQALLGKEEKTPSLEGVVLDAISQPIQVASFGKLGDPYANAQFQQDPAGYLMASLVPPTGLMGAVGKDISDLIFKQESDFETLRGIPGGDELRALLTDNEY